MPSKNRKIKIVVRGRGTFPYDMLRYDACFPYTGEDVSKLALNAFDGVEEFTTDREITLISSAYQVTPERWLSFGWELVSQETFTW